MTATTETRATASSQFEAYWQHLETLPWVAMALCSMRSGSDAFHSHLDGHPEILSFNGPFFVYDFWRQSWCANAEGELDAGDLAAEFTGRFVHKLKSRYDLVERKHQLGDDQNQSIDIDLAAFQMKLTAMMRQRPITCRNFLFSVYAAYALCLGEDIFGKRVIFHHAHKLDRLLMFLADFPDAKIVGMVRDPRAAIVSGVENWRRFRPSTDHPTQALSVIQRVAEGADPLRGRKNDFSLLRLEDIGEDAVMRSICAWMDVSYHECLRVSTWSGQRWWGDRLSKVKQEGSLSPEDFSKQIRNNKWREKLTWWDTFVLTFLFRQRLIKLGYEKSVADNPLAAAAVLGCILLPTAFELRYFSPGYLVSALRRGKILRPVSVVFFYGLRVLKYLKLFAVSYRAPLTDPPRFRPLDSAETPAPRETA